MTRNEKIVKAVYFGLMVMIFTFIVCSYFVQIPIDEHGLYPNHIQRSERIHRIILYCCISGSVTGLISWFGLTYYECIVSSHRIEEKINWTKVNDTFKKEVFTRQTFVAIVLLITLCTISFFAGFLVLALLLLIFPLRRFWWWQN